MQDWEKYEGRRRKELHDIKLFDGTVLEHMYPNANTRNVMKKFNRNYRDVKDEEVAFIRERNWDDLFSINNLSPTK